MVPSTALVPTTQQREAVEKISQWYFHSDEQVFRLFGYAGTGKTTLAQHIVSRLGIHPVLFAAYTGKAAYVLRCKGCIGASTIHGLIYQPVEKARARLHELTAQRQQEKNTTELTVLDRLIEVEERKLATPDWILREDSDLASARLLIVDEVSMVGHRIAADLLSFGVKILVLGDPAQLPPIEGGGYFINAEPDHLLTEIHRSALNSPVTRLATAVRLSTPGKPGGAGVEGDSGRRQLRHLEELLDYDQVLAGRNATRWQLIRQIREMQGLQGPPMSGDRIIVLANSRDLNVFNGQQFTVEECVPNPRDPERLRLQVVDDEGAPRRLDAWASGFTGIDGEQKAKARGRDSTIAATFAQAITTHKAQGSQWDRVLVVDESFVFARANGQSVSEDAAAEAHLNGQRWLYTAITRAAKQIVIVRAR